jgi:hypothetical protein
MTEVQKTYKMRMMTVIMNPTPKASAISLRRFFSMIRFLEYFVELVSSSEVIISMMAVTASQRPMSEIERGKCMCSAF